MAGNANAGHGASAAAWAACVVIMVGTVLGGIALIIWNWPLFWTGVALFVLGSIGGYFAGIMDSVTEYAPAEPSTSVPHS
jgi:ABC-type multidrug transport system permease subunit